MNNITVSFGKRIKNIRTSKRISQEKLAELCGLHPTYIGQLERGEKSPTLDSIHKISEGLEITIDTLFCNMEEKGEEDYAVKIYNKIIAQSSGKQEKIYEILCRMLEL